MFGQQRKDNPIFAPHFVLFPARKTNQARMGKRAGFLRKSYHFKGAATDEMPGRFFYA